MNDTKRKYRQTVRAAADFVPYPEEPRKGYHATDIWNNRIEHVRRQPGQWFVVAEYPAKDSAAGRATSFRHKYPDVQFRPQATGDTSKLYARYMPPEK